MNDEKRVLPMLKQGLKYLIVACLALVLAAPWAAPAHAREPEGGAGVELTAEEKAFLAGRQFRLGVDSARPPFEFIDEKGVYSGISAGFIQECAKRLGIAIVPVPGLIVSAAVAKAKTGEVDIIPKITPTPERAKDVLFTQVYATFPSVIISRKDARFIGGLDDLHGLKIGVLKGLVVQELLRRDYPNLPLIELPDIKSALLDLSTGKVDVFVDNLGTVSYNIEQTGLTNLKIAAPTPYVHDLAFAVRKDMPLLKTALDKALASISDQDRTAIRARWLALEYKAGIDWKFFGPIVASLIVVLAFVAIWNRRLRRSVKDRQRIEQELKTFAENLESRSAVESRIAKLSADLQQAATFEALAQTFMSQCVPLLGVQYGLLYVLDQGRDLLVPVGTYGSAGNEDSRRPFAVGQGLIGQCALEMKPITIHDTTDSGIFINWGMGEIAPKEILIQPLVERGRAIGVLQLASVRAFSDNGRMHLEEMTSMLAMNIEILDRNLHTKSLLAATKEQSDRLQAQQKELMESSLKRDEANRSLQQQVAELARARRTMMNIMEDLEMARKETEARNLQTQSLLAETTIQAEKLQAQQKQIQETETWFRGVIESAPDGMLVIDEKGGIILTNKQVEKMFGYDSGELVGEIIEILVPESVRDRHPALREGYMQKEESRQFGQSFELRGVRKDGSEFPVEIGLAILPAMGSKGRCVCASIRDITERKQIEGELHQHMEELEKFEKLTVGREEKMIELKQEINKLMTQMGKEGKYIIVD